MLPLQIAALLCDNPQGPHFREDVLGNFETSLGIQSRHVCLGNPIMPLKFFKTASDLAFCPLARRRPGAEALRINSRPAPRKWMSFQVRDVPLGPN